ncbi:MAG: phosphotransferase family protein [Nocardioides sp.]
MTSIPHHATARRLTWRFLPPGLRAAIEEHLGAPVVEAHSQDSGFTPGFASVLTCADRSRHFVKAASVKSQRAFADAYREEARILAGLPVGVPAPRLRWTVDDPELAWVAIGIEYVDGTSPARPWRDEDLAATLDALERVAAALTPSPEPLRLNPIEVEFAEWPSYWEHIAATRPHLIHLDDAAALAEAHTEATLGAGVVHTDVRADNVMLDRDGKAWLVDWNFPVTGAGWLDTAFTLIGPRGDGLDVEHLLATRPLTRDVPGEHVDRVLALLVGYFFRHSDQPVPPTSPYLRAHQAWQGKACWEWLCERRGWRV